jgi:TolB protein
MDTPGLLEIYTMTLGEGSNSETRRLTDASGNNYSPAWSQDGRWVVFVSDRGGSGDIYLIPAAEGGPGTLVTVGDGNVENRRPAISGNGRLVAYISNRDSENFQTYLINVSTSQVTRLTDNGRDDTSVIFSPMPLELLVAP